MDSNRNSIGFQSNSLGTSVGLQWYSNRVAIAAKGVAVGSQYNFNMISVGFRKHPYGNSIGSQSKFTMIPGRMPIGL